MQAANPRVYVIVLNWNNYEDTKRCLESLEEVSYTNLRTIVVDNGSKDGSQQRLQRDFPSATFLFNDKNLGFAKGANVGIRRALQDPSCAYALLFNNDAIMLPDYISKAVETAESAPLIAVVGGKTYQNKRSKKISYAGGYVRIWTGGAVAYGLGKEDHGEYDRVCETNYVTGGMMLIKRSALDSVGLLPEDYFFGTEDIDYCLSVQKAGFKLFYIPTLAAYHLGGSSFWSWEPRWTYNFYRNKLTLLRRHLPFGFYQVYRLILLIYALFVAPKRWQSLAMRHGYEGSRQYSFSDMQRAMIRAIQDCDKETITEETLLKFADR
ncbi:MAG: glycosyltransferase family 2 protein [Blastocatellia bacterium]